ncbi:MAG: hypothetical protein FJ190_10235 [Gammaproteobacteria bacterium]|nr:hypothetical protein [Gammaproteobacteria bacterium]
MNTLKSHINQLIDLIQTVRDKNLRWLADNQEQQLNLKHARKMAEKDLSAQLKQKSVHLAHEIELLKTRQVTELSMLKQRCQEDLKDYNQYLAALNQLKQDIRTSFPQLPDVIALSIHHHAKILLNNMWEATDTNEKLRLENQLIQFMATVHEEADLYLNNKQVNFLPEKTLRLINHNSSNRLSH